MSTANQVDGVSGHKVRAENRDKVQIIKEHAKQGKFDILLVFMFDRIVCYGKTRKQTECDGQTGYTAHILDGIIDKLVRQIFERMKAIPKSEIVNIRYREKMEERKQLLRTVRADYTKAAAKCAELQKHFEDAQASYDKGQSMLDSLNAQYDDIISWSDMYDTASFEAKKMIVNCLISRVEVSRGYKLHIDFNIDLGQFSLGVDIPVSST